MSEETPVQISQELRENADGRQTVIARLPRASGLETQSAEETVETLKQTADQAQQAVTDVARAHSGVSVNRQFWIANAVSLTIDPSSEAFREIAALPEVERLHENFEVEAFDETETSDDASIDDHGDHTYGLEQVNAPDVWEEFGTQGAGARVAVLDTGIDPDHPDLDLADGGWAEFDDSGEQVDTEPNDGNGHGTHVSGTVAGGAESGTHIGVAPDVELYNGKVLADDGGGTFASIIGGIEWAVEEDADIINMSLGATDYVADMIEPMQNAQAAGTLSISSSGNSGEGSSGSPANVYGAGMAIGASDEGQNITGFSSGELVDTDNDWGSSAPSDWPDEYIVPDVAAPGEDVLSAVPGGGYDDTYSGTSMAAPHVAGVAGLMIAAGGDYDPDQLWEVLEETAWKPDDWDEDDAEWSIDDKDSRYGKGIIDAKAAVNQVALDSGIEGTVTDDGGTAIAGAEVALDDGSATVTDPDGAYSLIAAEGEYTVTVDAFGFEEQSTSVTVEEGETTQLDLTLDAELTVDVLIEQPDAIGSGGAVETSLEIAHAETITVSETGGYPAGEATLAVDGTTAEFDEPVSVDDGIHEVALEVSTTEDVTGDIELSVTIEGHGDSETVSTGSTTVKEELFPVGIVDATGEYGDSIADTLDEHLGTAFLTKTTTAESVVDTPSAYDAVVVQALEGTIEEIEAFVETVAAEDVGAVYLDQWGSTSNGVTAHSESMGDPGDLGETHGDPGPIHYLVESEHKILDGHEPGETIALYDNANNDNTWFGDTEFDVLASTGHDDDEAVGAGLAVNEETRTVLASTLGRTGFIPHDEFTDEANSVLAKAVSFCAGFEEEEEEVGDIVVDVSASYDEGDATLDIEGEWIKQLTVEDLWIDWEVDEVSGSFDSIEDDVEESGTVVLEWDSAADSVSTLMTVSLPQETYVGGDFDVIVTATEGDSWDETATTITID